MKIKNQVVVITGSSAGLGRALAHRYAKSGAKIALLARSKESLATTEKELQVFGVETMSVSTDVSNSDQVEEAAKKITVRFGKIDTWINCAMVSVFSPVKEMTAEEYKRVTEVNYLGTVNGTLSALKVMLPQKRGTIIQVGSALSKRSIPLQSAYCATKHAINGFTEALRCELLHDKSPVKVVRVQLPAMNTPQFRWVKSRLPKQPQPVPPIFQPELIADAIFWAGEQGKREVYLGFSTWKAVLAEKFVPGFADWYLSKVGYKSQQTSEKTEPDRTDNLNQPRPEKSSMRGDFDHQAVTWSFAIWAVRHQTIFWLGLIILLGIAYEIIFSR